MMEKKESGFWKKWEFWVNVFLAPIIIGLAVAYFWSYFNRIDPNKIKLSLPYPNEYVYMGRTWPSGEGTDIIPTIPIEIALDKDNIGILRIGISNHNIQTLKKVKLHIYFPEGIKIRESDGWEAWEPNKVYSTIHIGDINNNILVSLQPITLEFIKPARYEISYTITGEDIKYINRKVSVIAKK